MQGLFDGGIAIAMVPARGDVSAQSTAAAARCAAQGLVMRIVATTKTITCHGCGVSLTLNRLEPDVGFSMVRTAGWVGIARDTLSGHHSIVLACSERCAHVTIERSAASMGTPFGQ